MCEMPEQDNLLSLLLLFFYAEGETMTRQLENDAIGMFCLGLGVAGLIVCFFLAVFVSTLDGCEQITLGTIQNICFHKTETLNYLIVGGAVVFGLCGIMALSSYSIWKKKAERSEGARGAIKK